MAGPPQQAPRQSRLAIHNRQRPRQAEETVPSVRVTRATSFDSFEKIARRHFGTFSTASTKCGSDDRCPSQGATDSCRPIFEPVRNGWVNLRTCSTNLSTTGLNIL